MQSVSFKRELRDQHTTKTKVEMEAIYPPNLAITLSFLLACPSEGSLYRVEVVVFFAKFSSWKQHFRSGQEKTRESRYRRRVAHIPMILTHPMP